jgi:hypothetical protein
VHLQVPDMNFVVLGLLPLVFYLLYDIRGRQNTMTGIRLATWNIRLDIFADNTSVEESLQSLSRSYMTDTQTYLKLEGEQPWSSRRLRIAETIVAEGVDVMGLQEALPRQIRDLKELLGDGWDWVRVLFITTVALRQLFLVWIRTQRRVAWGS